jgi:hypothetical protein
MTQTPVTPDDRLDRRQKRLFTLAWAATLLPLVAFAYLTWHLVRVQSEVGALETKKADLQREIGEIQSDLAAQTAATKYYRDFAGVRIQFYRERDRAVVESALRRKGFNVEARRGVSQLLDRDPNAIAYGGAVAPEDLRDIAIALVEGGFPLKRIAPATRQPDPKLIQVYASAAADESCGLLTVDQIRAGATCGPR